MKIVKLYPDRTYHKDPKELTPNQIKWMDRYLTLSGDDYETFIDPPTEYHEVYEWKNGWCDYTVEGDVLWIWTLYSHRDDDKDGLNDTVISIESIREIQSESNLKPFEGKYRVYIINGAEKLSIEASNALLKLLEEPPQQVVFILLTIDNNLILPTVLSRCKHIELRPVQHSVIEEYLVNNYDISTENASNISRVSKGLLGWAIRAYNDPNVIIEREYRLDLIEKLFFVVLVRGWE